MISSLSIDREFGLLVGDGLLFTSLSLANTNGLCLHVPISSTFAAAFRSLSANRLDLFLRRPAQFQRRAKDTTSIRLSSRSTHFAKAEVTSFSSLEFVHLRHVKRLLQHFLQTDSKRQITTIHVVLSVPVPKVEDAVFPTLLFHSVEKQVLALLSIAIKSELPTSPLLFQIET